MASESIEHLLDRLDELKRSSSTNDLSRLVGALSRLDRRRFAAADLLIRFHEALLFMRAYPQNALILKQVETILSTFSRRVELVLRGGENIDSFSEPEVSGIVGTGLTANFSYAIARWLAERHPGEVSIDLVDYEDGSRLGETLPRFVPLLEEESLVEASVPYENWLLAARPKGARSLPWLIKCFESLPISDKGKAELFDSLKLYIHWKPSGRGTTRTGMKLKGRKTFFHDTPLLRRSDVSLSTEMNSLPLPVKKLSRREGAVLLDMIRDTSAIRFRELHGFTFGDPKNVIRADAGRGVEFFINGVGPENRLPLRAYHSVFMVKNGIPVGYVEGLSLFERMEIGFNIYYTFREGESAWLYARILRLFRQLLGVTAFSVDPYQIGFENKEGIESGAFWFYRKLGFRPVRATIRKLVNAEERRLAVRPSYRTSAKRLRDISEGHMLYEFSPGKEGQWDRFQVHNLGLTVAREMGDRFRGDALRMRRASLGTVARALGIDAATWSKTEQCAFGGLALVLSLIPKLSQWTMDEKKAVVSIIRAKAGAEESRYLRLLQNHYRLRNEVIKLGLKV